LLVRFVQVQLYTGSATDPAVEELMAKWFRRWGISGLVALVIPVLGTFGGCTGADQPKLADAPKFDPGPPQEPPKIPGRTKSFTDNSIYTKYMQGPTTK
jgi:hypothetical protein